MRNKVKKPEEKKDNGSKEKGKSKKRINSYDYASWDKFDVVCCKNNSVTTDIM